MKEKKTSEDTQRKLRDAALIAHEKMLFSSYIPFVQEMHRLTGTPPPPVIVKKSTRRNHRSKTCRAASKDFLKTFEWRKLRMQALTKYGNKCMCCGASPSTGAVINVDHIKPRKLFPTLALELSNLQILCADCNHGKGNWDSTDWRVETLKESLMDTTVY